MSKTTAPLLSFGASGKIADTMVYGTWRGIPYVRRHVIPANPNTLAQQQTRQVFKTLNEIYLYAGSLLTAPWETFSLGKGFTARNQFVGKNVSVLRGETDFANFLASPGARGGLPPTNLVLTPALDSIDVTLVAPTPPAGWTLTGTTYVAFTNTDPMLGFSQALIQGQETATPDDFSITGLEGGEEYVVAVFLEWEKANGQTAYSVSLTDVATPTA